MAALTAVFALAGMFANAQQTTGNVTLQTNTTLGSTGGSVKVIDNKGTVKYLQSQNGVTMFTNTLPSGGVVTTWQLGGTLTNNTYIDVDGKVFALDGISLVNPTTLPASTDATDQSDHGTGTGWTILVRNEATGAISKLKASDLVNSGHQVYDITAAGTAVAGTNVAYATNVYTFTITGIALPEFKNVYVYRNGAKLIAGVDYELTAGGTTFTITTTSELPVYTGDKIEIHYVK